VDEKVITETRRAVEAVVMAAIEPVEPQVLAQLTEIPVSEVEALCTELAEEYERDGRGFALVRVAGGYRFQTHPDMAPYVERFVLEGQTARLSAPALETLAIVAYKQPVSRAQLAAIRGVSVESTLSTLEQRGYVQEVGHDPGPGQAILYGTTPLFLERLGLDSLRDLPPLKDFVPDPEVVEALERGLLLRTEVDPETEAGEDEDDGDRGDGDPTVVAGPFGATSVVADAPTEAPSDAEPEAGAVDLTDDEG
jgi:segregation and condensation protein B